MNSFTLTAVGNLARNPEAVAKGDITYTRFCLVGNDYAGKDDEGAPREIVTSLWFVAFGPLGESLVRNTRKGDQLIVEARVRSNNWTDKQGEKQYDLDFVVQGFRFGAPGKIKRGERDARREANGHANSDSTLTHTPGANGDGGNDHGASGSGSNTNSDARPTANLTANSTEKPSGTRSRRAAAPPP
jgi:single-strand DNA-binding protein